MNDKIKNFLNYTGIIGSIISAIAYLILTYVIVIGFETAVDQNKQILFAVLGALVGLIISSSLRSQGITFAKKEPESVDVMSQYYELINKKKSIKQMHTIKYFVVVSTIKDIITKGFTIGITTWFVMYIFMEGNGDYSLFLLALSNMIMFAGFGLVALSKAYDHYKEQHIPVIREIITKLKDQVGSVRLDEAEFMLWMKGKNNASIQQCKLQHPAPTSAGKQDEHSR